MKVTMQEQSTHFTKHGQTWPKHISPYKELAAYIYTIIYIVYMHKHRQFVLNATCASWNPANTSQLRAPHPVPQALRDSQIMWRELRFLSVLFLYTQFQSDGRSSNTPTHQQGVVILCNCKQSNRVKVNCETQNKWNSKESKSNNGDKSTAGKTESKWSDVET